MIKTAAIVTGNITTVGLSTIATIKGEDLRIWLVAICGLAITAAPAIYKTKEAKANARRAEAEAKAAEDRAQQERYDSMERRIKLCAHCLSTKANPNSCVVNDGPRPDACPLRKKK